MTLKSDNLVGGTSTEHYIDVHYEYYGLPDEDGLRIKSTDVWFATKSSAPDYVVVDYKDDPIPGYAQTIITAWSIHKAGLGDIFIVDRDDIQGLRCLLDSIEESMDRRDMASLTSDKSVE